jgi:hypothetical protein
MWEFGRRYSDRRPWVREDADATAMVAAATLAAGVAADIPVAEEAEGIRGAEDNNRRASSPRRIGGRLRRMTLLS